MPVPQPTAEELVQLLHKTTLPTVLVEGACDVVIYRKMEELLGGCLGHILPCGGRTVLFEVFDRRNEFAHVPIAFVADKDVWLFQGVPASRSGIIFTEGYSIENDVYEADVVERLLSQSERVQFSGLLDSVCDWFAFEMEECLANREFIIAAGMGRLLNGTRTAVSPAYLQQRRFRQPNASFLASIRSEYNLKLRGKSLFELLSQVLSAPSRSARFSKGALIEMCVQINGNPQRLERIIIEVRARLSPQTSLPLSP